MCERGSRRSPVAQARTRLSLLSGPFSPGRIEAHEGADEQPLIEFFEPSSRAPARVDVAGKGWPRLTGQIDVRVPVYRELPDGAVVKVTFGVAGFGPAEAPSSSRTTAVFERVEILGV